LLFGRGLQQRAKLLPIVQPEQGAKFGLVKKDANFDQYVTHKALDGLFRMVPKRRRRSARTR
jgi:hypothetical protein